MFMLHPPGHRGNGGNFNSREFAKFASKVLPYSRSAVQIVCPRVTPGIRVSASRQKFFLEVFEYTPVITRESSFGKSRLRSLQRLSA